MNLELINDMLIAVFVIVIISYATGLVLGGPKKANGIISWEFKKLANFGRWLLKNILTTIGNAFLYLGKQFDPPKKKKKKN